MGCQSDSMGAGGKDVSFQTYLHYYEASLHQKKCKRKQKNKRNQELTFRTFTVTTDESTVVVAGFFSLFSTLVQILHVSTIAQTLFEGGSSIML